MPIIQVYELAKKIGFKFFNFVFDAKRFSVFDNVQRAIL